MTKMIARHASPEDYPIIKQWYAERGEACFPSEMLITDTSVVISDDDGNDVLFANMYSDVNAHTAWIGYMVGPMSVHKLKLGRAIKKAMEALEIMANIMDIRFINFTTQSTSLAKHVTKQYGYMYQPEHMLSKILNN